MSHKIKWLIGHEPIDYFIAVAECFAEEVNKRTDGAFEVEILSLTDYANKYNGGERITKEDLMQMLQKSKRREDKCILSDFWRVQDPRPVNEKVLGWSWYQHPGQESINFAPVPLNFLCGLDEENLEVWCEDPRHQRIV